MVQGVDQPFFASGSLCCVHFLSPQVLSKVRLFYLLDFVHFETGSHVVQNVLRLVRSRGWPWDPKPPALSFWMLVLQMWAPFLTGLVYSPLLVSKSMSPGPYCIYGGFIYIFAATNPQFLHLSTNLGFFAFLTSLWVSGKQGPGLYSSLLQEQNLSLCSKGMFNQCWQQRDWLGAGCIAKQAWSSTPSLETRNGERERDWVWGCSSVGGVSALQVQNPGLDL